MKPGIFRWIFVALALSGCSTYRALPLEHNATLKQSLNELTAPTPPVTPLTLDEAVQLTLHNNPDLLTVRNDRQIAQAQTDAAGVLPNPSVSGSYDFLLKGPDTMNGFTAGIAQDIKSLITLSSRQRAAEAAAQQIDATLLWQEWQTIGKVRLLFVDIVQTDKVLGLLRQQGQLFDDRLARSRIALNQGNLKLMDLAPDIAAAADLRKQVTELEHQQLTQQHDFNNLLGLASTVAVPLDSQVTLPETDPDRIDDLVRRLPEHRPDLVALQLAYAAQEEKLYGAVLAQFPTLSLGLTGGQDTAGVQTLGPQVTFDLPIFDFNQSAIAVERATRQQLHDDYSNRLATSRDEVVRLRSEDSLASTELQRTQAEAAELDQIAARLGTAYQSGDVDERAYVDIATAQLAKHQQAETLTQQILEQDIALATLLGAGLPDIAEAHP